MTRPAAAVAAAIAGAVALTAVALGGAPAQARAIQGRAVQAPAAAAPTGVLTVSAAASLTDVFPVIAMAFEKRYPGVTVRFNFGGSPALVEQVNAGAPVDVLATASEPSMAKAVAARTVGKPWLFAKNTLTIAVPPGNPAGIRTLGDLARADVKVAVCAVTVPCGAAARDLLAKNGVTVRPVTQELDVRAVLSKVMADEVDAGIVYATDAWAVGKQVRSLTIPAAANVTTTYPIAAVVDAPNPTAAAAFVTYVRFTPSAQGILRAYGFAKPW